MKVLKFGGTSLATAEAIGRAAEIIIRASRPTPLLVVVSALGGVTNRLVAAIEQSLHDENAPRRIVNELYEDHRAVINSLLEGAFLKEALVVLDTQRLILERRLTGVALLGECPPRVRDTILSAGERISQAIVAGTLRARGIKTEAPPAEELILTNDHFGNARVRFEETQTRVRQRIGNLQNAVTVVAGFLGATEDGDVTTLGRDGSDYSASIFAAAFGAECVEIWSDVDGVLSSDPTLVSDATLLSTISYREAAELAFFGAKVLHPKSILPLEKASIPVLMKNSSRPLAVGTLVQNDAPAGERPVKVLSAINDVTVLRVIARKPGLSAHLAERFFNILNRLDIQPLMVSQSSSDASFSLAVHTKHVRELRHDLHNELLMAGDSTLGDLRLEDDKALIALIGNGITTRVDVSALLFSTLQKEGVALSGYTFGVTASNISLLVDRSDAGRALNLLHHVFVTEYSQTIGKNESLIQSA